MFFNSTQLINGIFCIRGNNCCYLLIILPKCFLRVWGLKRRDILKKIFFIFSSINCLKMFGCGLWANKISTQCCINVYLKTNNTLQLEKKLRNCARWSENAANILFRMVTIERKLILRSLLFGIYGFKITEIILQVNTEYE